MTADDKRFAYVSAPKWREKIQHLAQSHHVPVRQEALACLYAAMSELRQEYGDAGALLLAVSDVVEDLRSPQEGAIS